jgi:hypothetical protein
MISSIICSDNYSGSYLQQPEKNFQHYRDCFTAFAITGILDPRVGPGIRRACGANINIQ